MEFLTPSKRFDRGLPIPTGIVFLQSKLVSFDSTSFSKRDGVYNPRLKRLDRNYLWKICDDLFCIAKLVRNQTFRLELQNLFGKVLKTEVKIQKQSFIV